MDDENQPENKRGIFDANRVSQLCDLRGELTSVFEPVIDLDSSRDKNLPTLRTSEVNREKLLIPKKPWSIVLYRGLNGVTVLHNPDRRLVSVKQLPSTLPVVYGTTRNKLFGPVGFKIASSPKTCSTCGRPWPSDSDVDAEDERDWVNSDYFNILSGLRSVLF